jgi:hypothetical protein
LLAVIFTHIADVVNHTPEMALNNARIFAVAIIVISFRLFQIGRVMFEVIYFNYLQNYHLFNY